MSELVKRYVHQVGRHLPRKERAEVEAELRSQIEDQLEDRYGASPSQAQVAAVLSELGAPRHIAASYNRDHYLVGPVWYPYLILLLRQIWVIVPLTVIFLNVFGALTDSQQGIGLELLIETLIAVIQATLMFSGAAVLIFALIQRVSAEIEAELDPFDPLKLPEVDDPHVVDRIEASAGLIIAAFVILIFLYFLQVGGLTLRFDLSDPGDVIPVPTLWLALAISAVSAMLVLALLVLRRNRWTISLWLTQTMLELFGLVCLYFVLYQPLTTRLIAAVPSLAEAPVVASIPEILVVLTAVITLLGKGSKLVNMWNARSPAPSMTNPKPSA